MVSQILKSSVKPDAKIICIYTDECQKCMCVSSLWWSMNCSQYFSNPAQFDALCWKEQTSKQTNNYVWMTKMDILTFFFSLWLSWWMPWSRRFCLPLLSPRLLWASQCFHLINMKGQSVWNWFPCCQGCPVPGSCKGSL